MPGTFDLSQLLGIPELPEYLRQVEACMEKSFVGDGIELQKPLQRLMRARGKRLRPALVIASALATGGKAEDPVIRSAAAVELIHIGSLIHDDIIDDAERRWGIATINAREGLDQAILAGDLVFSKAFGLAAEASQAAGILAAQTIAALTDGQAAEIAFCYDRSRTKADLERAMYGKTAALMSAACRLGGICSGLNEDQQAALSYFGEDFGMSFQLIDDALDFISSDSLLGKPVGNDVKEGVYTLPVILSLSGSKGHKVAAELQKKMPASKALICLLIHNGTIGKTLDKASKYAVAAQDGLVAEFGETVEDLGNLPIRYFEWAVSDLIDSQYRQSIRRL